MTDLLMTNCFEKNNLNSGEHTLIPVTTKMIHSTVSKCKRLVLKDGQPLHMVKFVGAVRNYSVHIKNVMIHVEDGTGLVQVILWRKENECTAEQWLIHNCNGNSYICVIGEVKDYYGVHKIIDFDIQPVSSGNKVTHHFLEVAYSFEKTMEYAEDEMLRAVHLK
jgi:replication factor A2